MSYPSLRFEETKWATIDKNGERCSRHTLHHPLNPDGREFEALENFFKEIPFQVVISLFHINFRANHLVFPFFFFIEWRISWAINVFSWILRPSINAVCYSLYIIPYYIILYIFMHRVGLLLVIIIAIYLLRKKYLRGLDE